MKNNPHSLQLEKARTEKRPRAIKNKKKPHSSAAGVGSIPGQGTKIPLGTQPKDLKKKKSFRLFDLILSEESKLQIKGEIPV